MSIRGATAVVGVGNTEQGQLPGRTADELAIRAIELALQDAGLQKTDVDGLITCKNFRTNFGVDEPVGALLGINPEFSASLNYGASNFSLHLGVMALVSGLASTVVLAYGTNQRSKRVDFGFTVGGGADMALAAGLVHVGGSAAMAFRRHQHLYGTTEEQLGWVAVSQREWARLNPLAIFRDPLSIEDYLAAEYLVEPLRRADLTMISDGGAAIVLTTADRARDFPRAPVYIQGIAEHASLREDQNRDNLLRPWFGEVAKRLWASSGMSATDVDVLYIQEATSVWVLQMIEAFGFCGPGEGGQFLAEGHTRPGGDLPLNTNGGQLSEAYMWGWLHLCEAVRQLRGECGARQLPNPEVALHCSSRDFLKGAATILSTSAG